VLPTWVAIIIIKPDTFRSGQASRPMSSTLARSATRGTSSRPSPGLAHLNVNLVYVRGDLCARGRFLIGLINGGSSSPGIESLMR
jgi:hypothetical protein